VPQQAAGDVCAARDRTCVQPLCAGAPGGVEERGVRHRYELGERGDVLVWLLARWAGRQQLWWAATATLDHVHCYRENDHNIHAK
jgi:hypothetical protein